MKPHHVLDVHSLPYPARLCAAALQGLVNRGGLEFTLTMASMTILKPGGQTRSFSMMNSGLGKFRACWATRISAISKEYRQRIPSGAVE